MPWSFWRNGLHISPCKSKVGTAHPQDPPRPNPGLNQWKSGPTFRCSGFLYCWVHALNSYGYKKVMIGFIIPWDWVVPGRNSYVYSLATRSLRASFKRVMQPCHDQRSVESFSTQAGRKLISLPGLSMGFENFCINMWRIGQHKNSGIKIEKQLIVYVSSGTPHTKSMSWELINWCRAMVCLAPKVILFICLL